MPSKPPARGMDGMTLFPSKARDRHYYLYAIEALYSRKVGRIGHALQIYSYHLSIADLHFNFVGDPVTGSLTQEH
ncbi:hypothetical protein CTT30_00905 [Vibrio coralliilyticus]|nr:hypothetical protein CTT30_00905 [Vibrio coralliilyticus]